MKNLEKYIVLLVILFLISHFGSIACDVYFAQTYGATTWPLVSKDIHAILAGLVNVGACALLFSAAKAESASKIKWALFGLFFGLIAVVIFYAATINKKLSA